MTDAEIHKEYWTGEIRDNKIVWKHSNATTFFKEQGIEMSRVLSVKRDCDITVPCAKCAKRCTYRRGSRTAMVDLAKSILNGGARCSECYQQEEAAAALARQQADERAAIERERLTVEKMARREKRRASVALKYGNLFTGEVCPRCFDGFLIARLASTTQRAFLGCSSYNPHKYNSCDYSQPLAPDLQEQYLEVFRRRLSAPVVA